MEKINFLDYLNSSESVERECSSCKFSLKHILALVAAIMMALVTFTACDVFNPDDDDDEIENGNNGGVAGKRLKTTVQTTGPIDAAYRQEFSYNSNGELIRCDHYDESSKLLMYHIYTSNPDGTRNKDELYEVSISSTEPSYIYTYTYDANKKPLQGKGTYYWNGVATSTVNVDYTFQNGRLTREVLTSSSVIIQFDITYDNNGRRRTTTETHSLLGTRQYNRTYNTDGTLQKVTYPNGYSGSDNTTITEEFTWENGKSTQDGDDLSYL